MAAAAFGCLEQTSKACLTQHQANLWLCALQGSFSVAAAAADVDLDLSWQDSSLLGLQTQMVPQHAAVKHATTSAVTTEDALSSQQMSASDILVCGELRKVCQSNAAPLLVLSMEIVRSTSGSLQALPRVMSLPGCSC